MATAGHIRYPVLGALLLAAAVGAASAPSIDRLAWLAGCWTIQGADPGSVEQWTAPAGGTMLGVHRIVENGRTRSFEFLRIREDDSHGLVYVATPSGQATAEFTLAELTPASAVFENPDHNFPQRIAYRLANDGRLRAVAEGLSADGSPRRFMLVLEKSRCAADR